MLTEIEALGQPEQRTTTYEREARSHLVTAVSDVVDGVTRRTAFTYDGSGHVLTVTKLAWTVDAVTTTFSYEPQFFQHATVGCVAAGRIASVSDPGGRFVAIQL